LFLLLDKFVDVAPRVGAWIEKGIFDTFGLSMQEVAPRVGAWIEKALSCAIDSTSLVAPRVGAWIENANLASTYPIKLCRSSRRNVD